MTSWRRRLRLAGLALVGLLPNVLKKPLYRVVFGYRFGAGVRIGLTLLDAEHVDLGEGTRIGHLNVIVRVGRFADRVATRGSAPSTSSAAGSTCVSVTTPRSCA